MKRILNKLIAVLLIATLAVGLTACKEIENGSEIHMGFNAAFILIGGFVNGGKSKAYSV